MLNVEFDILMWARLNIKSDFALLHNIAIKEVLPFYCVICLCEAFVIIEFKIVAIVLCNTNRTIAVFHLKRTRMRSSVRQEKSVNTEVAVVLIFAVVTAIGVFVQTILVINCMVCKFPNATAHHIVSTQKCLNIAFKFACTNTHCVSIFAKVKRLFIILLRKSWACCNFVDHIRPSVHLRNDIICPSTSTNYALIMNRNIGKLL